MTRVPEAATTRPRAVLIGIMGAGKTSVASLLAGKWGVTVRDTDQDVEAVAGTSIADIFVDHGEAHMRALEREAVGRALAEHDGVLALGGGAVLDPDTRRLLEGHTVVFLQVGFPEAVKRVGMGVGRPLLLGNVRAQLKRLLDERTPIYTRLATIRVVTDGKTPEDVAEEVRTAVEAAEAGGADE